MKITKIMKWSGIKEPTRVGPRLFRQLENVTL